MPRETLEQLTQHRSQLEQQLFTLLAKAPETVMRAGVRQNIVNKARVALRQAASQEGGGPQPTLAEKIAENTSRGTIVKNTLTNFCERTKTQIQSSPTFLAEHGYEIAQSIKETLFQRPDFNNDQKRTRQEFEAATQLLYQEIEGTLLQLRAIELETSILENPTLTQGNIDDLASNTLGTLQTTVRDMVSKIACDTAESDNQHYEQQRIRYPQLFNALDVLIKQIETATDPAHLISAMTCFERNLDTSIDRADKHDAHYGPHNNETEHRSLLNARDQFRQDIRKQAMAYTIYHKLQQENDALSKLARVTRQGHINLVLPDDRTHVRNIRERLAAVERSSGPTTLGGTTLEFQRSQNPQDGTPQIQISDCKFSKVFPWEWYFPKKIGGSLEKVQKERQNMWNYLIACAEATGSNTKHIEICNQNGSLDQQTVRALATLYARRLNNFVPIKADMNRGLMHIPRWTGYKDEKRLLINARNKICDDYRGNRTCLPCLDQEICTLIHLATGLTQHPNATNRAIKLIIFPDIEPGFGGLGKTVSNTVDKSRLKKLLTKMMQAQYKLATDQSRGISPVDRQRHITNLTRTMGRIAKIVGPNDFVEAMQELGNYDQVALMANIGLRRKIDEALPSTVMRRLQPNQAQIENANKRVNIAAQLQKIAPDGTLIAHFLNTEFVHNRAHNAYTPGTFYGSHWAVNDPSNENEFLTFQEALNAENDKNFFDTSVLLNPNINYRRPSATEKTLGTLRTTVADFIEQHQAHTSRLPSMCIAHV